MTDALERQLVRIARDLGGDAEDVKLERPRNPEHGDVASNLALVLAGRLGRPPRAIADEVLGRLDRTAAGVAAAEVAGPGFINFRLSAEVVQDRLAAILERDEAFGRSEGGAGTRVQIEFVSANPTGPLHVAHGRGAAYGDAIASLLAWTGHEVEREFYVNDAGVQIDRLGESVEARWQPLRGESAKLPEGGYRGEYVVELARELDAEHGPRLAAMGAEERTAFLAREARERMLERQRRDLAAFGVRFDSFFPESRVYEDGRIPETMADLAAHGLTYEDQGATWLRTSAHGDDKDRVLVKSDGTYTYFLPDIAYHRDKVARGFDRLINVWGADHHGYIPRMQAALAALGHPGMLDVDVVQMVRVMRDGEEVKLSKRAGEIVTLHDLIAETGRDVARYFFLMRRPDAQMVFDLGLALDASEKNPVYKVKYAHARMMSIFRRAGVPAETAGAGADLTLLTDAGETDLIQQLAEFPDVVERAARDRAPHLVCEYLEGTAGMVNAWYHAGNPSRNPELAVLVEDAPLRDARLALARGVRIVLRNGLAVLGLEAPDRMDREDA
ncbi:MAG TPA: arginine--tRNA ligase [Longimicrobiales bacterium]|nr:arginine--tRNA ligase [Longimicrobiales bacterium]